MRLSRKELGRTTSCTPLIIEYKCCDLETILGGETGRKTKPEYCQQFLPHSEQR